MTVDGFLYAFVGTFSIFILRELNQGTRRRCLEDAVKPLLSNVSFSLVTGLWMLLFGTATIAVLIPFVFMITSLWYAFFLAILVKFGKFAEFEPKANR
jgi:hypothetical protein